MINCAPISAILLSATTLTLGLPNLSYRDGGHSMQMWKWKHRDLKVANSDNELYLAVVSVAGKDFSLQLDTGSTDLWFAFDENYNQTIANAKRHENLPLNLTYGTGWASGYVGQIDVSFDGYNVSDQAFLIVQQLAPIEISFHNDSALYDGIAGLGFDTLSQINEAVLNQSNNTWGRSLMSNIFRSNPSLPKHIAFFLDRTGDLNDKDTGLFDIGTYASGYGHVSKSPKIPVYTPFKDFVSEWNVLVNKITVGGKSVKLQSEVTNVTNVPPKGTVSALLDTGTSLALVYPNVWHAIYKPLGGVLTPDNSTYLVPCLAKTNVEVTIEHQKFPIHPLDLTLVQAILVDGKNMTVCVNAIQPTGYDGDEQDFIFGDTFLRNVYAVYNYGEYNHTQSGLVPDSPFVQLLALTNAKKASKDFKKARAKTLASMPPEATNLTAAALVYDTASTS